MAGGFNIITTGSGQATPDPYFKNVSALLTGNPTNTAFTADSSSNNFAVTNNNAVAASVMNPFGGTGYYSNSFNGSTDYLTVPSNAAFQFGTGDFTVEFWINQTSLTGYQTILTMGYTPVTAGGWALQTGNGNGNMIWYYFASATTTIATESGATVSTGTWYHIAVVRSGTTTKIYRNGVLAASGSDSNSYTASVTLGIGAGSSTGFNNYYVNGYISNLRVVKGQALYTTAFTPSTTPLTTTSQGATATSVSLLTCQSPGFVDNGLNQFVITAAGSPSVRQLLPFVPPNTTALSGSGYFSTSSQYLNVASSTAFQFGTGAFTVEGWFYYTNPTANALQPIFTQYTTWGANAIYWGKHTNSGGPIQLWVGNYSTSSAMLTDPTNPPVNSWVHYAIVRNGNTFTMYRAGVAVATNTFSGSVDAAANPVYVGVAGDAIASYNYAGYMSNFRIVKGVAAYTTNFVPPTTPLAAIGGTGLLTLQTSQQLTNNTFVDFSGNNYAITRNGDTTGGAFTPYAGNYSNFFDGNGDYLSTSKSSGWLTSGNNFTVEAWAYLTGYPTSSSGNYASSILSTATNTVGWDFSFWGTASSFTSVIYFNKSASMTATATFTFSLYTWYHVAAVKNGTTVTVYINGVATGTGTLSTWTDGTTMWIGADPVAGYPYYLNGYISNLRVVDGYALYTANFTPPTAPLSTVPGTQLLTCQSNRFIDRSANGFTLTKNGDVTVARLSPFSTYLTTPASYSATFNGTSQYMTAPASIAWAFDQGAFTVEAWVYITGAQTQSYGHQVVGTYGAGDSSSNGWALVVNRSTATALGVGWYSGATTTIKVYSTTNLNTNTWYHLAAVRTSIATNGVSLYVNGTVVATGTDSFSDTVARTLYIGSQGLSTCFFPGVISNLRITKGSALYLSSFNPPGTALATTQNIYNQTYSAYFNGSTDYLTLPSGTGLSLGTFDFTIEAWVYPTARVTNGAYIIAQSSYGVGTDFLFYILNAGTLSFYALNSTSNFSFTSTQTILLNSWTHVAVVRSGSLYKIYINGANDGSTTNASSITNTYTPTTIGNSTNNTGTVYFPGFISNLRVTKGLALYTANFTTPTTALANTGTGVQYYGQATGSGNYLSLADDASFKVGTSDFTLECWYYPIGSNPTNGATLLSKSNTSSYGPYSVGFEAPVASSYLHALSSTNGSTWGISIVSTVTYSSLANRWNHVAYVRSGSTFTLYSNGVSVGTATSTSALVDNTNSFMIGYVNYTTTEFPGIISNARMVKGQALYIANFTPNSTTALTATVAGTTAFSVGLNGSTDYLLTAASNTYNLPNNQSWTLEYWVYLTTLATAQQISFFSSGGSNSWTAAHNIDFGVNTSGNMYIEYANGATPPVITGSTVLSTNTWYHLAYVYNGSAKNITTYVNGVRDLNASSMSAYAPSTATPRVTIGRTDPVVSTPTYFVSGYVSNFRITPAAVYSAPFTVPTTALTTTSTTTPYFSGAFNGSNSYITATYDTNVYDWWTQDCTIECWVYPTTFTGWSAGSPNQSTMFGNMTPTAGTNYWSFGLSSTGQASFFYWTGTQNNVYSTLTVSLNTWSHIAMTKTPLGITLFVNGVGNTPTALASGILSDAGTALAIGSWTSTYINGYVSNLRMTKGAALYTATFTPSTTPLLTATTDVNAYFSGGFPASGSYITGSNASLNVSSQTSVWTVECWVYPINTTYLTFFCIGSGGAYGNSLALQWSSTSGKFKVSQSNGSAEAVALSSTGTYTANAWYHVAATNTSAGVRTIYVNGIADGTVTYTAAALASGTTFVINGMYDNRGIGVDGGTILVSNVRFVSGINVYTGNFTVPTAPLTSSQAGGTNISSFGSSACILLTCQNNTFIDNSGKYNAITRAGSAVPTTANPFQSANPVVQTSYSGGFNGSSQYLSVASNAAFTITGDFTIECWVYSGSNALVNSAYPTMFATSAYNGTGIGLKIQSSGGVGTTGVACVWNNGSQILTGTTVISNNTWYHVAVSRSGTSTKLFVNGVVENTITNSTTFTVAAGYPLVGADTTTAGNLTGYISNLRIVKGQALYTAAFTPSTTPLTTTSQGATAANVSLLTCQSSTFIDNSPNNFAITNNGSTPVVPMSPFNGGTVLLTLQNNVMVDNSVLTRSLTVSGSALATTANPFQTIVPVGQASYSGYFNGSSQYLSTPSNAALGISTGDFTIELWVYFNSVAGYQNLFDLRSTQPSSAPTIYIANNSRLNYLFNSANPVAFGPNPLVAGTWYHVAWVRASGTNTMYVNGTSQASFTDSSGVSSSLMSIGARQAAGAADYTNGYISNLRMTKGQALYTANFIPSAAPLTTTSQGARAANVSLLTCQNATFIDNSANNFTITNAGTTLPQSFNPYGPSASYLTAQSNWFGDNSSVPKTITVSGTPRASANSPFASIGTLAQTSYSAFFNGSSQYLTAPSNPGFQFGTSDFTVECWAWFSSSGAGVNRAMMMTSPIAFSSNAGWAFLKHSSDVLRFIYTFDGTGAGGYQICDYSWTPTAEVWYHLAATKSGTSVKTYINGALAGNSTLNATVYNSTQVLSIGSDAAGAALFSGYISNARIVKGQVLYTGSFVVPAAPLAITQSASTNIAAITQPSYSAYFNGTSQYLTMATANAPAMALNGNFTIECWAYATTTTNAADQVFNFGNFTLMMYHVSTTWTVEIGNGTSNYFTLAGTAALSVWHHFAVTRSGNTYTFWVDGASAATNTSSSAPATAGTTLYIGRQAAAAAQYFTGYISNFRIVNGVAVYTGAFTPPTAALTATQSAGTNIAGIAQPSNSVYFTTGWLTTTNTAALPTGTESFTVEMWVLKTNAWTAVNQILLISNVNNAFQLWVDAATGSITLSLQNVSSIFTYVATGLALNTWHHIAVTRSSNTFTLYVNGASATTATNSGSFATPASPVYIGNYYSGTSNIWAGYISNLRIVRGQVLYTGAFTPSAAPLTTTSQGATASNVSLLTCQSSTLVDNSPANSVIVNNAAAPQDFNPFQGGGSTILLTLQSPTIVDNSIIQDAIVNNGSVATQALNPFSGSVSLLTLQSPTIVDNSYAALTITNNGSTTTQALNPFNAGATSLLAAQSNSVVDRSPVAKTITITGTGRSTAMNPYQSVNPILQPTYSGYFNGSSTNLSVPASYSLNLTGNFTVECWFFATTYNAANMLLGSDNGANSDYFSVTSSTVQLAWATATGNFPTWNYSFSTNTWYHVAAVRVSGVVSMYVNGVPQTLSSGSASETRQWLQSVALLIGRYGYAVNPYWFPGYISNLRIVNGQAIYTGPFTPPATALTATQAAGTNIAAITQPTYSLYFNGSASVVVSSNQAYSFGTSDFTIEFWTWPATSPATNWTPFMTMGNSGGGQEIRISQNINATGVGYLIPNAAGNADVYAGFGTLTVGQWAHLALVRYGSTVSFYKNGLLQGSTTSVSFNFTNTTLFKIGGSQTAYADGNYTGFISNLRIVKGQAVYTGNFATPTAALATTQSAGGTNIQAVGQTSYSVYFNGSTNYLTSAITPGQLGSGDFTIELWSYLVSRAQLYPCYFSNFSTYGTGSLCFFAGHNVAGSTKYSVYANNTGSVFASTANIVYNVWTHLALVRSSGTLTLYINGVADVSTAQWSGVALNGGGSVCTYGTVGDNLVTGALNGYISNFRITKGQAVYTANFVPSASPLTTTSQGATSANVAILTCQSTTIRDNSVNNFAITGYANVTVQTTNPFNSGTTVLLTGQNTTVTDSTSVPAILTNTSTTVANMNPFSGTVTLLTLQNTDFVDNSYNAATITNTGTVVAATLNPLSAGGVVLSTGLTPGIADNSPVPAMITLNGSVKPSGANALTPTAGSTALNYSTYGASVTATGDFTVSGNYTVELWVYLNAYVAGSNLTLGFWTIGNEATGRIVFGTNSSGVYCYDVYAVGTTLLGSTPIPLANWVHVATCRVGSTTSVYYNGAFIASTTAISGTLGNASNMIVGPGTNGYISNFRYIQGTGLYTAPFTPPTTALTATQTTYSGYFGGSQSLTLASNQSLTFGTGDFTVELWFNTSAAFISTRTNLAGCMASGGGLFAPTNTNMNWNVYGVGDIVTSSFVPTLNQWYHLAYSRAGTTGRLFINGLIQATGTDTTNYTGSTFNIGGISTQYFNGYVSNLRVTKGLAVYTGNFAPPTTALATIQTAGTNIAAITAAGFSNYFTGGNSINPASTITAQMLNGFAGGIFTIECWLYPTNLNNGSYDQSFIGSYAAVAANGRWSFTLTKTANTTTSLTFSYTTGTGSQNNLTTTATPVTQNQWNHVAVTINASTAASSTIVIFANGASVQTWTAQDLSTQTAYYSVPYIGGPSSSYLSQYIGFISNMRVVVGAAVYTGAYTVPTAALGVSQSAGTNTAALTPNYSVNFSGSGQYLVLPTSAAWQFPADFTVEFWINFKSVSGYQTLIGQYPAGGNDPWILQMNNGNTLRYHSSVGPTTFSSSTLFVINTWYHVALVRSGTVMSIYTNGTSTGSATISGTIGQDIYGLTIGAATGGGDIFTGYISNVRIVKGQALYTATFTPSTTALTTTSQGAVAINVSLLTCQNATIVDNSKYQFSITNTGTATAQPANPYGGGVALLTCQSGTIVDNSLIPNALTNNSSVIVQVVNPFSTGSVSLLTCQSPTFVDNSGLAATVTNTGTAVVRTLNPFSAGTRLLLAQNSWFADNSGLSTVLTPGSGMLATPSSPFSSANPLLSTTNSVYFSGNTQNLTIPATTLFEFGTGDFTIEMYGYWLTTGAYYDYFVIYYGAGLSIYCEVDSTGGDHLRYTNYPAAVTIEGPQLAQRVWNHLAIVRQSGTIKLFVNGCNPTTGSDTANFTGCTGAKINNGGYSAYFSNLRVTKGQALYTAGFAVPTSPLTTTSQGATATNVSLLALQSPTIVDNSLYKLPITNVGTTITDAANPFGGGVELLTVQSATLIDNSPVTKTLTQVANVTPVMTAPVTSVAGVPAVPYSTTAFANYGSSMYFDGTGDYLSATTTAVGTASFTYEAWVYPTATGQRGILTSYVQLASPGDHGILLQINSSNQFSAIVGTSNASMLTLNNTSTVTLNVWTHVAFTRSGTACTLWVNGASVATGTYNGSLTETTAVVGAVYVSPSSLYFLGYISNPRIVNGTAIYTTNFAPPVAPVVAVPNTALLVNPYTNGTAIVDYSMNFNGQTIGDTKLVTSVSKFGRPSMYFDGSGDRIAFPVGSPLFAFGSSDFTVEAWVYVVGSGSQVVFCGQSDLSTAAGSAYVFYVGGTSTSDLYVGSTSYALTSPAPTTNTWAHVAWVRNGTSYKDYLNGTQAYSTTLPAGATINTGATTYPPTVGALGNNTAVLNGYIADLRITKGIARYTANFTVPGPAATT